MHHIMPGYQFIHLESYGRTGSLLKGARRAKKGEKRLRGDVGRSAGKILAEALRATADCTHVPEPLPPIVLLGDPQRLADEVEALGTTPPKGQRKDTPILLAGVASAPWSPRDPRSVRWRKDVIAFARAEFGAALKAALMHEDERHDHLHFFVAQDDWAPVGSLHPGRVAQAAAKAAGQLPAEQRAAYRAAMRGIQDRYHAAVGQHHGQARIGPARRRLSRVEWQRERQQAEAAWVAKATADELLASAAETARAVVERAESDAATLLAQAMQDRAAAGAMRREAENVRHTAELESAALLKDAKARITAYALAPFNPVPRVTVELPAALRKQPVADGRKSSESFAAESAAWEQDAAAYACQQAEHLAQRTLREHGLEDLAFRNHVKAQLVPALIAEKEALKSTLEALQERAAIVDLFSIEEVEEARRRSARKLEAEKVAKIQAYEMEEARRRDPSELDYLRKQGDGPTAVWVAAVDRYPNRKALNWHDWQRIEFHVANDLLAFHNQTVHAVSELLLSISPIRVRPSSKSDLLDQVHWTADTLRPTAREKLMSTRPSSRERAGFEPTAGP